MAILNVAFLNPRMRAKSGGEGASILSDRLSILESSLLGEGNELSVGDINLLIDETRKIQNSGVLTQTQISNYNVKIARYQQQKESILVQRSENIDRMDNEMKKDDVDMFKILENNPIELTRAKVASLTLKIDQLTESIQKRELLGQDATDLILEKRSTKTEWDRKVETMKAAEAFEDKGDVAANHAAYVVTNDQGEIIKVDYAPTGTIKGYAETNATMNGFRVYGKINEKVGNDNFFRISFGGQLENFSAPDIMMPDAAHPGEFKPTKLIGNLEEMGPYVVGRHGYIDLTSRDFGEEGEENIQGVQIQRAIPKDSWAKGLDGTMYHRKKDGNFEKHLNIDYIPRGFDPKFMYTISPQEEAMIWRKTDETIDHADIMEPEEQMQFTSESAIETQARGLQEMLPSQRISPAEKPVARARTTKTPQQPREQASPGIMETAKRTFQGGVDYLKSRFS